MCEYHPDPRPLAAPLEGTHGTKPRPRPLARAAARVAALMNENDIDMFIKAFDDFMKHSEVSIEEQKHREEVRLFYERKAAEHEVTVDYYLQEFV